MLSSLKSRFAAVNADENGAETIEVVLLTVFFVLVVGGVAFLIKTKISDSSSKLSSNFDTINKDTYAFGGTTPPAGH